MNNSQFFKMNVWKGLLAVAFALVFMALTTGAASAGDYTTDSEIGNVCLQDYVPGASCVSNDMRIEAVYIREMISTCSSTTEGTMTAEFELLIANPTGAPERYDVAYFVAAVSPSGAEVTSALSGDSCYHTYLSQSSIYPLLEYPKYEDYNTDGIPDLVNLDYVNNTLSYTFKGWLNLETATPADVCGDISPGTQMIVNTGVLTIPCRDVAGGGRTGRDPNGILDISVCGSWDSQKNDDNCTGITTAYNPLTPKCSCADVDLYGPTAIEGLSFSVKNNALPTGLILSALGLVLIGGVLLSLYLRRRIHA